MDVDNFIGQAWTDHAADAAAVAARLQPLPPVTDEAHIVPLAHLAHHVLGQHLGRWQDGIALLQQLAALPCCPPQGDTPAALRRFQDSLLLATGDASINLSETMAPSDRIRVTAMAAASLAAHDTARASALLHGAAADFTSAGLSGEDVSARALAANANNIAGALEEMSQRTPAQRNLMIAAAQMASRFWRQAGGWLEDERAEYRLALVWLQAGDVAQARQHAQRCLDVVAKNQGPALEQFFGWVALGRVERAAGNAESHAQAITEAQTAFAALAETDRAWCQVSLTALRS